MKRRILIVSLVILLGGICGNYLRFVETELERGPSFGEIPYETSNYTGEEHRFPEPSYKILLADTTTLREYHDNEGNPIWLFIGYFRSQEYGSQIHSPRHCLPGSGWKIRRHEPHVLRLRSGRIKVVNRLVITERQKKHLMFYWFETRSGTIRNEFALKWDLMKNSLLRRPTDAAFIRLNLPVTDSDGIEVATDRAIAFLNELCPAIRQSLPFSN